MEYQLKKNLVDASEYALDSISEQPVDADVILPDYCPDIERILRCMLLPCVYTKSVSGGQLTVEGGALIRALYIDSEKRRVRCFEHTVPWSQAFSLKETPEQFVISVRCKTEYINCRAMSPRKLSFHGAFSLYAKVIGRRSVEISSPDEEGALECLCEPICVSDLTCLCEEQFSQTEDISLGDKPQAESILNSSITIKDIKCKCIDGKLMLSAEGELDFMYLSQLENDEIEHMSYVFPISRIIDCEGMDENTVADITLSVQGYDLSIIRDALSEDSLLTLELKLSALICGYTEKTLNMVTDAYATDCAVELSKTPVNLISGISVYPVSRTEKLTVQIENETVSQVLDIGTDSVSASASFGEEGASVSTKLKLCMLLRNKEGETFYLERSADFDFKPDVPLKDRIESVCVCVDSVSFRIVDEKTLELRIALDYRLTTANSVSSMQVSTAESAGSATKNADDSALILYFAEKGERVWDISKTYSTAMKTLMGENGIEGDRIEQQRLLLIPVSD